jgi:[protein-PII] uridylyltransferase
VTASNPARTGVAFDNRASASATVVDIQAPDSVGLLHRITSAFAELELDIRKALVSTVGHQVVDAFYVRDRDGRKLTDDSVLAEIERALLHAIRTTPA